MRLQALERLIRSMRELNIHCQLFEHRHGEKRFDVIFFVGNPSEMVLGARGAQPPLALSVEVDERGSFKAFLGDQYGQLCDFLELQPNPENPFSPSAFFAGLGPSVPERAERGRTPLPRQISVYRPVDEAHKNHFVGWRYNERYGERVSPENLHKTGKLLGPEFYDFLPPQKREQLLGTRCPAGSRARLACLAAAIVFVRCLSVDSRAGRS